MDLAKEEALGSILRARFHQRPVAKRRVAVCDETAKERSLILDERYYDQSYQDASADALHLQGSHRHEH
jgi:hypothetical protein